MVVILKQKAKKEEILTLIQWIKAQGIDVHIVEGTSTTILGLIGDTSLVDEDAIKANDIVANVRRISEPFKAANRKFHPNDTIVDVCGKKIGGGNFQVIAGPCSVESREQINKIAKDVQASGAGLLRGGAFKPRTSPYAFQGLRAEGIEFLIDARKTTGMPIVTEIMSAAHIELFKDVETQ